MSDEIRVNKVSDKQARRAEHIEDKLEKKGLGRDQAEEEALEQAVEESGGYSNGGPNAGGEKTKHAKHERATG